MNETHHNKPSIWVVTPLHTEKITTFPNLLLIPFIEPHLFACVLVVQPER